MKYIGSGYVGDVYKINDYVIKIGSQSCKALYHEYNMYKTLTGTYGIPNLYKTYNMKNVKFIGINNEGIWSDNMNDNIKFGDGFALKIDYCGKPLKNLKPLDYVMFNIFYIMFNLYNRHNYNHNDAHMNNILLKEVKSFQKTYYIGKYKYVIKNQKYKAYLIDLGNISKKSANEMNDIIFINNALKYKYIIEDNAELFFKKNFYQFMK